MSLYPQVVRVGQKAFQYLTQHPLSHTCAQGSFPCLKPTTTGTISRTDYSVITGLVYSQVSREDLYIAPQPSEMADWALVLRKQESKSDVKKTSKGLADAAMAMMAMDAADATSTKWLMLPCGELDDMQSALMLHGIGECMALDQS